MAKLTDLARVAGLTAGAEVMVKTMRPQEIIFDPELDIFGIDDGLVAEIAQSMKEDGFDKSQPLVLWKGRGCVVDGRTRLKAALAAGLPEVPVVEKEFETLEDAVRYAFQRQAERRNLTQGEILEASIRLGIKTRYDGKGRGREQLAKDLGVSESTITRARTVASRASRDDLAAIRKGGKTINEVYQGIRKRKEKELMKEEMQENPAAPPPDVPVHAETAFFDGDGMIDPLEGGISGDGEGGAESPDSGFPCSVPPVEKPGEEYGDAAVEAEAAGREEGRGQARPLDDFGDPAKINFLHSVLILLGESRWYEAANLLINHFIPIEKHGLFIETLPFSLKEGLNRQILTTKI